MRPSRDTAATRLALAGCTVAEIRAITGHTLKTEHNALKHDLALDDRMADAGVAQLKKLGGWGREGLRYEGIRPNKKAGHYPDLSTSLSLAASTSVVSSGE